MIVINSLKIVVEKNNMQVWMGTREMNDKKEAKNAIYYENILIDIIKESA
jgi:hypothetical protein